MTAFTTISATIANGAALSASVSLNGRNLWSILMPSGWTAADITFQGSIDGTNFFDIYEGGTEYQLAVAASRMVTMTKPFLFYALTNIKIRSGTAATPVNQGAERVLSVVVF